MNTLRVSCVLALLLFTCLLNCKQDIEPISFEHQLDASVSSYSIESGGEDSAQDDLFPLCFSGFDNLSFVIYPCVAALSYVSARPLKRYITPHSRAPPID
ncbi:hypothetical protein [Aestuariibacter sp. A3R04]|uniref:hypothetical protein n=1 Tax=Aestuariibacter sp. A3R04 TaxID=2841571 RepID=UPI001C0968A7|nr:hypothetical protein [Aestuariibacter sp. A3R04]MBU3021040.1 hypothetical protein [Aestuariibacter sp. A3R04]